jgi:hypothetical protein
MACKVITMADETEDLNREVYRAARETRNFEISLFWERSNYFLVLSTAIGIAFFAVPKPKHEGILAAFGMLVAAIWFAVNLGSKFWQSRWEHRLRIVEKALRPGMDLFSASWETVQDDVRQSLEFRKRGPVHRLYGRLVLLKPSVTMMMTLLSALFFAFWMILLIVSITATESCAH